MEGRPFSNSNCHSEPFASCHSECSEESHGAQDRLSEAISLLLSEIAELVPSKARKLRVCFVAFAPRNDRQGIVCLAMTTKQPRRGWCFLKREEPPEFRGALGVSEVLPIKLESGYSSGSDYQDKQGNNQHPTNTDYDINPSRGYRCFYYIW